MHPSEKVTKHLTVRGGVNPYGQPDRKISAFFFDDFPKPSCSPIHNTPIFTWSGVHASFQYLGFKCQQDGY